MALLHQLFDVDDLKNLDAKELEILKDAITHEIRTNPDIRNVLFRRAHEVYRQLKAGTGPGGPAQP
jgi:hypothetical protein